MKEKDKLIYDLIFSDENEFLIDIGEYVEDIYKYDEFVNDIKKILKKSKVSVLSNTLDINSKTVIWKIKVRK